MDSSIVLYLGFRYYLDSNLLILELTLFTSSRASMTKMASPYFLSKLILSPEILVVPEALVERLLRFGSSLFGNRTFFWLPTAKSLS